MSKPHLPSVPTLADVAKAWGELDDVRFKLLLRRRVETIPTKVAHGIKTSIPSGWCNFNPGSVLPVQTSPIDATNLYVSASTAGLYDFLVTY